MVRTISPTVPSPNAFYCVDAAPASLKVKPQSRLTQLQFRENTARDATPRPPAKGPRLDAKGTLDHNDLVPTYSDLCLNRVARVHFLLSSSEPSGNGNQNAPVGSSVGRVVRPHARTPKEHFCQPLITLIEFET